MEVTMHAVYEVTSVANVDEEDLKFIPPTDSEENKTVREAMAKFIEGMLGADHVVCTSMKYFVSEEESKK